MTQDMKDLAEIQALVNKLNPKSLMIENGRIIGVSKELSQLKVDNRITTIVEILSKLHKLSTRKLLKMDKKS